MTESERERIRTLVNEPDPWPDTVEDGPVEPLTSEDKERLLGLFDALDAQPSAPETSAAPAPAVTPIHQAPTRRRGVTRAFVGATVLVAAAAAITLWVRGRVDPLPVYTIQVEAPRHVLGDAPGAETLRMEDRLHIELLPRTAVTGEVEARAWLAKGDEPLRAWAAPFVRGEGGELRIEQRVREVPELGPGRWRLVFVVGRPGHLPADAEVVGRAAGQEAGGGAWRVLRREIVVEGM